MMWFARHAWVVPMLAAIALIVAILLGGCQAKGLCPADTLFPFRCADE